MRLIHKRRKDRAEICAREACENISQMMVGEDPEFRWAVYDWIIKLLTTRQETIDRTNAKRAAEKRARL